MSNPVRIIIVVLCALALWYLVVVLAKGMSEEETGSIERRGGTTYAAKIAFPASGR